MRKSLLFNFFLFWLLLGFSFSAIAQDYSLGKAPTKTKDEVVALQQYYESLNLENPALAETGYGSFFDIVGFVNNDFASVPVPAGNPITNIAAYTTLIQGGDIANGLFYATDASALVTFDLVTGAKSTVAAVTGVTSGQTITALAYDDVAGVMYMGTTDVVATSQVYTLNLSTAAATLIGTTGQPGLIAMAISCAGELYSVDLVQDNLWSISTSTGVGTAIGPLGYDANYAQDADWDAADGMMYIAAYNNSLGSGELRVANVSTGSTTLLAGWPSDECTAFGIDYACTDPCPTVGEATNPNPANGATNVSTGLSTLSWTNDPGATVSVEVFFNGVSVYNGAPVTSISVPITLDYATTYSWKVNGSDGSCTQPGATWSFTTEQDPNLMIVTVDIYPQSADYWTGTCDASTKTEVSYVNCVGSGFAGWMAFDCTPIVNDPSTVITEIIFNGYLYNNNFPYWSITPMGSVNPITGTASAIYTQVSSNVTQGSAYSYNAESGTLVNGWQQRTLNESTAYADLKAALGQGWFAIGIQDWDAGTTYFVDYEGWAQTNVPYLTVTYQYVTPVELTSFTANANYGVVDLQWITATEINNKGFEVQRSNAGSEFQTIAFVEGYGTTTESQVYTYSDKSVEVGSYTYRLKQIDFDGTTVYSNEIETDVPAPSVFALGQNYPNPFNPSTKINFQLKVDSKVSLKVFDVLGQEVATLVNSNLVAGGHSINFDASRLNSGVYLYRIEATGADGSNFVDVKKMILTK